MRGSLEWELTPLPSLRGRLTRRAEPTTVRGASSRIQTLVDLRLDCDGDTILARVDQKGVACHTGRRTCLYKTARPEGWTTVEPVITDPAELYGAAAKT